MNVKELLENKKIDYKASGRDFLVLCTNPEHEDTNPSMRIDQVLGIYQCLSCGHKGNLFVDYNEVPRGLEIKREKLRRTISQLRSSSIGLEIPEDSVPFQGTWRNIQPSTYQHFRAFRSAETQFMGRIVFPITDITGRIVVFQGRDELNVLERKYFNWPKHIQLPLFPVVEPVQGSVILVEGLFDMLNLYDKGITNSISVFGINTVKKETLVNLKFQGVSDIICMYDPDEAGDKGAEELEELSDELGLSYKRVRGPTGIDPGELSTGQVQKLKEKLYNE